jgi:hypothetical protein
VKCATPYCRKEAPKSRKLCNTCRSRIWREKNPIAAAYKDRKHNAKHRGIEFAISLEYFTQFCIETDYIRGKGRTATSYTIDRKDPLKGYVEGNLQILELKDNVAKGNRERKLVYDYRRPDLTRWADVQQDNTNDENYF